MALSGAVGACNQQFGAAGVCVEIDPLCSRRQFIGDFESELSHQLDNKFILGATIVESTDKLFVP